ncbi:MAG: hypothetical protein ABFR65_02950 [Pseudomonadota bacterium]
MRIFNTLKMAHLLKVASILLLPVVAVADVVLYPGYIQGTVTVGDFNVYNTSVSASGGGYSSSKSTAGNTYSLTVQGGDDWEYYVNTTAYVRSTTSNYPYTRMYFSPRYMTVPEDATVQNDYNFANPGVIQFQINITGDAYTSWNARGYARNTYVVGQERTYSYGYAYSSYSPTGVWEMPVVPNTDVRIYAYVYVDGKRYDFETGYPYYYEDIAPGETIVVPINIVHDATPSEYGTIQGNIELTGADGFNRHRVYAYGDNHYLYTNPGDYLLDSVRTGLTDVRAYSWFDNYRSYLQWPYIDGDYQNNRVDVVAGGIYNLDLMENAGTLTGDVTFTGTMTNADLNYFQLRVYPADRIYEPSTGWIYQTTRGGYAYQTTYSSDPDPSAYRLFLTQGPWRPYYLFADSNNYDSGYYMRSYFYIYDFNHYYDGSSYNFGQNVDVAPGATTLQDREYCTGSLLVRFRDASGGLLRYPRLEGSTNVYEDGKRKLYLRAYGYSSTSYMAEPEVEVHGHPATYPFYARAYTADNSYVTFARFDESLECGVRKGRDFDGPTLIVETPPAGDITNALSVNVSGTATDDSGVASITINGVSVTITPTGNPDDINEVSYTYDLPVVNGENTITVVALDTNDNESSNERDIYVDHWLPVVTIDPPADGSYFSSLDNDIALNVDARDQGYGYTLTVMLDGAVLDVLEGAANDTAPVSVSFADLIGPLSVGTHQITAQVEDIAGNTAVASSTITSYLATDVRAKPEARHNKEDGTSTIFVTLPNGLTATASLSIADNREISATPDQIPIDVHYSDDDDQLLLKFNRTPELMEDSYYEVEGLYCPNPSDPTECYTWRGADTTEW